MDRLGSAEHWLQRARETRATAASLRDPEMKKTLLHIAERYEELAKMSELERDTNPD